MPRRSSASLKRRSPTPESRAENSRFSRTVNSSLSAAACPRNRISRRDSLSSVLPRQRTSPAAGRVSPASVRNSVVLPLPLAPRTRSSPPACSAIATSENRRNPPRSQVSAVVSSMPLILLAKLPEPAAGKWSIVQAMKNPWLVPFLNLGHLLDHLAMLVFPTAVVAIGRERGRPYSELLPLALGSFIAFGVFAIPAGWLADHWSRYKVLALFFVGIGASLFATGFAQSPWQIALGLGVVGAFAAIYHPVGIAMLVASPEKMGSLLGWNGLWGNLGLASAALLTGALVDSFGWRAAFHVPGVICILAGIAFVVLVNDPGKVKKTSKSLGLH